MADAPIETFSDVLHHIIDVVLTGDVAAKAHAVIDQASGPRTVAEEPAAPDAPTADETAAPTDTEPAPATGAGEDAPSVPGA